MYQFIMWRFKLKDCTLVNSLVLGQTRTKPRTCPPLPKDSFTPLADEKINQIKTVGVCH